LTQDRFSERLYQYSHPLGNRRKVCCRLIATVNVEYWIWKIILIKKFHLLWLRLSLNKMWFDLSLKYDLPIAIYVHRWWNTATPRWSWR